MANPQKQSEYLRRLIPQGHYTHRSEGRMKHLLTLWEIMNKFDLEALCTDLSEVTRLQIVHEQSHQDIPMYGQPSDADKKSWTKHLYRVIESLSKSCAESELRTAREGLWRILTHLNNEAFDSATLAVEAQHAKEFVLANLTGTTFLTIAFSRNLNVWDNENLLGTSVAKAFPESISDIKESGNCILAECSTAAVFHLMRVVEWGLRALCKDVGLLKVKRTNKKTKKSTYVPIPYTDWETMLNQLQDRVDIKIDGMKRGLQKQRRQEFYYPDLQDIRAIRDAWRNHVMHTRAEYTLADTNAILGHVKRLMESLATDKGHS